MKYCYASTICIEQFVNLVTSFFWLFSSEFGYWLAVIW